METSLPTTRLGTTDMDITRVGLGAWAIGGGGWYGSLGPQDDESSLLTIRHAVAAGVNWVDTAAIYGLGHSEEVLGKALAELAEADRPYVFTKGGLVWSSSDPTQPPARVGAGPSLRREVEASLRRLRLERIDLYQMHWPAQDGTPVEEYWSTLLDLKAEGKVRAVGLSNHDVAQLEAAAGAGHVDSLQPPFNAIRRSAAADVIPWCAAHDTGVIVYSPMESGLLSGSFDVDRVRGLDSLDLRRERPEFQPDQLRRNLAVADALTPVARRHDVGVGTVAVAWTIAFVGVTGAIVGARTPGQVDGWLSAARLELDAGDLEEIANAIDAAGAGSGPSRP